MKKIVLDTSLLVSCANFKIDWQSELERISDFAFEVVVLDRVFDELKSLRKDKTAAKLALAILKHKKITATKTTGILPVDTLILNYAVKNKAIVATQDIALKKRLKARRIKLVTIRQKGHLIVE